MDAAFTTYDPHSVGSKGLVFIGNKVLLYRRDARTDNHPLTIDLPGGAPEGTETPFQTFIREVAEEFGLTITANDVVATHIYDVLTLGHQAYFFVARLPASAANSIVFGNEGLEYLLMTPAEYLSHPDAWSSIREQARRYLEPHNT